MDLDPGTTSETTTPCYLLPWKCCTGYLKRWGYKPLAKKYFKELTLGAIPIIFAASFSTFMITLIEYIAEDNEEEKDGLIAGQTFIYASLTYLLGLFLSIRLKLDLQSKNPTQITEWLEKQKFTEVVFGIFAESSAFALKEFLAMFALKIVFLDSGVGPSFGIWLLCASIFTFITAISSVILKKLNFSHQFKELVAEYNADSFALPLAFVITVIFALSLNGLNANFTNRHGYLYEWNTDDNEEESEDDDGETSSSYYYLYASVVGFLAAFIMVIEERYCCPKFFEERENEEDSSNPRATELRQKDNDNEQEMIKDGSIQEDLVDLWHNFVGRFVGVAFYVMIVDEFIAPSHGSPVAVVIVSFLLAFIINWRGPPCLAATVVRKDKTEDRLIERRQEIEIRNNNNPTNPSNPTNPPTSTTTSNNSAAASTNNDLQQTLSPPRRKSCDCYGCYLLVIEWYTHLQVHRRGITIISVRLIIGWTWETFIASLIEFIADAQELETSTLVGVDFAITIACLLAGYLIHYFLKDWNVDLPPEEGEGAGGVRRDTENPLQHQRSADESHSVPSVPQMER